MLWSSDRQVTMRVDKTRPLTKTDGKLGCWSTSDNTLGKKVVCDTRISKTLNELSATEEL